MSDSTSVVAVYTTSRLAISARLYGGFPDSLRVQYSTVSNQPRVPSREERGVQNNLRGVPPFLSHGLLLRATMAPCAVYIVTSRRVW